MCLVFLERFEGRPIAQVTNEMSLNRDMQLANQKVRITLQMLLEILLQYESQAASLAEKAVKMMLYNVTNQLRDIFVIPALFTLGLAHAQSAGQVSLSHVLDELRIINYQLIAQWTNPLENLQMICLLVHSQLNDSLECFRAVLAINSETAMKCGNVLNQTPWQNEFRTNWATDFRIVLKEKSGQSGED